MAAKIYDKALCAFGLLLFAAAAAWMLVQRPRVETLRRQPARAALSGAPYSGTAIAAANSRTEIWPEPTAQSRGLEWTYDVFTPPEIYYNRATHEFSVTIPVETAPDPEAARKVVPFGVELVQIKLDPFRLQLIGYAGNESNFRGTFENVLTKETFLGRAGRRLPDLGLTIVSLQLKRERIEQPDSTPVTETVAVAVVRDDVTGEETVLNSRERRTNSAPSAILRISENGEQIEHKEGATFSLGEATYTVGRLQAAPASVEISKKAPDLPEAETKVLTPPAPPDAAVPAVTTEPVPPAPPPSSPF